jgi:hypothetical protein
MSVPGQSRHCDDALMSSPALTGRPSIPEEAVIESKCRSATDAPLELVIGLAEGETRWRGMTTLYQQSLCPIAQLNTRLLSGLSSEKVGTSISNRSPLSLTIW